MGSSTKNPPPGAPRKGPETIRALRDSLMEVLRSRKSAEHHDTSLGKEDEVLPAELPRGSGIAATELPIQVDTPQREPPSLLTEHDSKVTSAEHAANLTQKRINLVSNEGQSDEASWSEQADIGAMPALKQKIFWILTSCVFIIVIIGTGLLVLSLRPDGDVSRSWLSPILRVATGPSTPHNESTSTDFGTRQGPPDELARRQDQFGRDLGGHQERLNTLTHDFAGLRRQLEELAVKQQHIAEAMTARQNQQTTMASDIATVRDRLNQLAAEQEQIMANVVTRQDQLKAVVGDLAIVRRQLEDLGAKQDQETTFSPAASEQLKTMANDFAAVRRQMDEFTTKQNQMAEEIARLQRILSQRARRTHSVARPIRGLQN